MGLQLIAVSLMFCKTYPAYRAPRQYVSLEVKSVSLILATDGELSLVYLPGQQLLRDTRDSAVVAGDIYHQTGIRVAYPAYVGSDEIFCAGTDVCSDTQIFIRCELMSRIVAIRNFSVSIRISQFQTVAYGSLP